MKNRIIFTGLIAIGIISLLFFIIPITPTFIVSYIFTIISIVILIKTCTTFDKGNNGVPQSYAKIYIVGGYVATVVIFSLIAYILLSFNMIIPLIIHLVILGVFGILFNIIGATNEYISKIDNQESTEERKKFVEEKKNYWK